MPQTKKLPISPADLKRRRAAASMQWTPACTVNSPSATILHSGRHEERRSYKALSIGFIALALLAGCGDSEPSNSDIKKQLSTQISPCPEVSVTNFKKVNGFPQNDGSYIDQVQYTLVFTPSDQMRDYVDEYNIKKRTFTNEGTADAAKVQAATDQINVFACTSTYQQALKDIDNSINNIPFLNGRLHLYSEYGTSDLSQGTQNIDDSIAFTAGYLKMWQGRLSSDESSNQWPQQHIRDYYGNMSVMTQDQAVEVDQKAIADYQNDLNILGTEKATFENAFGQLSSCQEKVEKITQSNQSAFDHIQELNSKMLDERNADLNALQNEMNKDCPLISLSLGGLGLFNADINSIDAYGKTQKITESESIRLIKSDNGWVIQN